MFNICWFWGWFDKYWFYYSTARVLDFSCVVFIAWWVSYFYTSLPGILGGWSVHPSVVCIQFLLIFGLILQKWNLAWLLTRVTHQVFCFDLSMYIYRVMAIELRIFNEIFVSQTFYGLCLQIHCIETKFGMVFTVINYRSIWVLTILTILDRYDPWTFNFHGNFFFRCILVISLVLKSNLVIIIHSKESDQVWYSWIFDRVMSIWINLNSYLGSQVCCLGYFMANVSQSYKYTLQQDIQA
jgi:hypothetical protein